MAGNIFEGPQFEQLQGLFPTTTQAVEESPLVSFLKKQEGQAKEGARKATQASLGNIGLGRSSFATQAGESAATRAAQPLQQQQAQAGQQAISQNLQALLQGLGLQQQGSQFQQTFDEQRRRTLAAEAEEKRKRESGDLLSLLLGGFKIASGQPPA